MRVFNLSIISIIDISLIALFVVIILFTLIKGLISMKKGIFNTGFRFIFISFLIIVAIFLIDPIADALGKLNLSFIGYKFVVLTNSDASLSYNAPITNLFDTVKECIRGAYLINGMNVNSAQTYNYIVSLTSSIIMFLSFFIEMLFIVTIGNLISTLLYHLIFKHFIPVIARNTIKLKPLSFAIGSLNFLLATFLFLSPISSIINLANQAYQNTKSNDDSEKVKEIGTYLDAYNDSIFAQVFFNWTTDENGFTFDSKTMEYITRSTSGDITLSLYNEINNLLNVGTKIGNALMFDENGNFSNNINYSYILSKEVVESLFSCVKESNFILYLLPIAFNIASNLPQLSQYIDPNLISDDNIDWSKEIDLLETVYFDLEASGLLDTIIDKDKNNFEFNSKEIILKILDEQSYSYVNRILLNIDNSKVLKNLLPIVAYKMVNSDSFKDGAKYMFKSFDQINDISWGYELSIVYDTIYQFNELDKEFINNLLDQLLVNEAKQNGNKNENTSDEKNNELLTLLTSFICNNYESVIDILIGKIDKNGNLKNVDEYGYSIVYKNGKKVGRYTLFDSQILKGLFEPICNNILKMLETKFNTSDFSNLKSTIDYLLVSDKKGETSLLKFKKEFASTFKIFSKFASSPELIDKLISNSLIPENGSLADIDKSLPPVLADVFSIIDKSKLFSSIVYPIIEKTFKEDLKDSFKEIGLDTSSFDYNCQNLGREYSKIFNIFDELIYVSDVFKNETDMNKVVSSIGDKSEIIGKIINTIYLSNFFNPKYSENENFYIFFDYIFKDIISANGLSFKKQLMNKDLKWEISTTNEGEFYFDKNGEPILDGEIGAFVNTLKALADSQILTALNEEFDFENDISKLETEYHISSILAKVGSSYIFKVTFGDFLDVNLESSGFLDTENNISFNNVTDWKQEGLNLRKILLCVDKLNLNLSNFDITNVKDIVSLNELLHSLSSSMIFSYKDKYLFPNFIFSKLKDNLKIDNTYLLIDPNKKTFETAKGDFKLLSNVIDWNDQFDYSFDTSKYVNNEYVNYFDNPKFYEDYLPIFNHDELGHICKLVYHFSTLTNIDNILNSDPSKLENIFTSLNETKSIRRMSFYNLYDYFKTNVNYQAFSLESLNNNYCLDAGKDEMTDEIDYLMSFYKFYYKYKNKIQNNKLDPSIIDKELLSSFKGVVQSLNKSYIFHRDGPFDENENNLTVFQNILNYIVSSDLLASFIYDDNSPKDVMYGRIENRYKNKEEKTSFLLKNTFPYKSSDPKEVDFSLQEEEIDRIFDVISSFTGLEDSKGNKYKPLLDKNEDIVFNIDNVDFKNSDNIVTLKHIITNLNNSSLLYDCVPGCLKYAFTSMIDNNDSSLKFSYLKFSDTNIYYQYMNMNENGFNFENRYTGKDIDLLFDLLNDFSLTLNGKESGIPNFNNFSKLKIDDFKVILDQISSSPLFNGTPLYQIDKDSKKIEYISKDNTTIYEQFYIEALLKEGVKNYYYSTSSIKDKNNEKNYQDALTKAIYEIKNKFNDKDLTYFEKVNKEFANILKSILGSKEDGYNGISQDFSFENIDINKVDDKAIYDSLVNINNSDVFFDIAPNLITEFAKKIDESSSTKFDFIEFAAINTEYQYSSKGESGYNFESRLSDNDLLFVRELIKTNNILFSKSDSALNYLEIDLNPLKDLYKRANISGITHLGGLKSSYEYTFFQTLIQEIFNIDGIKNIIYLSSSPKDFYYSNYSRSYTDAPSKINYIISNFYVIDEDDLINQCGPIDSFDEYKEDGSIDKKGNYGEIGNIFEALNSFKNLKTYNFEKPDLIEVDTDLLIDVLKKLNNSITLKDSASNAIKQVIDNFNKYKKSTFKDIDFSKAEPFYIYGNGKSAEDFDNEKYDDTELNNLGQILDSYKKLNTLMADSNLEDITSIEKGALNELRVFTLNLYNSNMFFKSCLSRDSEETTVFEEFIIYLMDQTKLSDKNYLDQSSPFDSSFVSKDAKIKYNVKQLTFKEYRRGEFKLHNYWKDEINSIFEFFNNSYDILNKNKDAGNNINNINFNVISPEEIKLLMYSLNKIDIVSDALNYSLRDCLNTTMNVAKLATYDFDGLGNKTYLYYYLSQLELRNYEIDKTFEALKALEIKNENDEFIGYLDINEVKELSKDETKLEAMLDYLSTSKILTTKAFDDVKYPYLGRDVCFLNTFKNLGLDKYLSGSTDIDKTKLINGVCSFKENQIEGIIYNAYDPSYESKALKYIIDNSSIFTEINAEDISQLSGNMELILTIFEKSYNVDGKNHYSYFLSDILSNFLSKALNIEYNKIDEKKYDYEKVNVGQIDVNNLKQSDYKILNEYEKNGLEGGLMISKITSLDKNAIDTIETSFAKLGSYEGYGNSKIGSIYYLSYLKKDISKLKILGFEPDPSDDSLYGNGFSFKIFGEQLTDFLSRY